MIQKNKFSFPNLAQVYCSFWSFNSLPNNKILGWNKLKAFVDDKMKVNEKLKLGLVRIENIVKKKKKKDNCFLPFPHCFALFEKLLF